MTTNQKDSRNQKYSEIIGRKTKDHSANAGEIPGNTELEDIEENEEETIKEVVSSDDFTSNDGEGKSFDQSRKRDSM